MTVTFVLAPVAERIPFAVLAGILLLNGWNIIDWRFITRIHAVPRSYALVMVLTALLVLLVDINVAIVIGLVVAGLEGARRTEHLEVRSLISVPLLDQVVLDEADLGEYADPFEARTGLVVFPDRVTVASAREIGRIIRADIWGHQIVVFDMSRTLFVDDSAAVLIGDLIRIAMAQQSRTVIISGLTEDVRSTLSSFRLLDLVPDENIVEDMDEAKEIIRPILLGQ